MADKAIDVLEKYDFEVFSTSRGRGVLIIHTNKGPFMLREYKGSGRHITWINGTLEKINESGLLMTDAYVPNKEDNYISVSEDDNKYVVKKWYECRDCNIRNFQDAINAVKALGIMHNLVKEETPEGMAYIGRDVNEEYQRHNNEIIRVKKYIYQRHPKNNFEILAGKVCEKFYEEGVNAYIMLKQLKPDQSITMGMIHGDYNYHNICYTEEGFVMSSFEKMCINYYMCDLYNYMRKIMEKYDWDIKLGYKLIDEYDKERSISSGELELLAIMFSYPEKFWKIINSYYNSNKAWISARNYEKLEKIVEQNEKRLAFINTVH